MKPTPSEDQRRRQFEPGVLSPSGFLGEDTRHIHDIVAEDARTLAALGLEPSSVADALQRFIDIGKGGLEGIVEWSGWEIRVQWDRGMGPCPFGEPGLYPKILTEVRRIDSEEILRFTQLGVHLIRRHGFFGGKGSVYRLDPQTLHGLGILSVIDSDSSSEATFG